VAHNPRRDRTPEAPPATLTDAQIADAMAKAVALRRRTLRDPATVDAVALDPRDAARATEGWRLNSRRYGSGRDTYADSWFLVGWVGVEVPWDFTTALGHRCYHQTWAVWLNAADGRVWLRWERHGRWAAEGDPYP
jgi:hypothetical protein